MRFEGLINPQLTYIELKKCVNHTEFWEEKTPTEKAVLCVKKVIENNSWTLPLFQV